MIDITSFMDTFLDLLDRTFGDRVWFVGLQGSYGRGEATDKSDIDMVVILDRMEMEDVRRYHEMLHVLPHRELLCGFFAGKEELLHWEPSDLFQFYYDTVPIMGSLDCLLPLLDRRAVERAVTIGACNLYHGCVHNMLYEQSKETVRTLYKSASFTLQAIAFLKTGMYIRNQRDLLFVFSSLEKEIVLTFLELKNGGEVRFWEMSERLLAFAKSQIQSNT